MKMNNGKLSEESLKILNDWNYRLNKAQIGHYLASEKYLSLSYFLGISLVLSSTIVTMFVFLDLSILSQNIRYSLISISIYSSIIASIITFLRPSEKAEIHRNRATKYGDIRRKVELFLMVGNSSNVSSFIKDISKEWSFVSNDSPVTKKSIRKKVSSILKNEKNEFDNYYK